MQGQGGALASWHDCRCLARHGVHSFPCAEMRARNFILNNCRGKWMTRLAMFVFALLLGAPRGGAQEAKPLPSADERYKGGILLVVAHPDDEGGATPYLARAIYDEHKRVSVGFTTRRGRGGKRYLREHGTAPGGISEQEARE